MKKLVALILGLALLLATTGCHYFHGRRGHPHGMPPGQAKKVVAPVRVHVNGPAKMHPAKPWK